ncbi:MAG: hypothetical protein HKO01_01495, partial [Flaviramulus sp.]|nr:hypothetical protein [Flaviramulus sp.]
MIVITLLLIHFFFKERGYWESLYFYTFPLPIIILITLLLSIFLNKKWRRFNLIIASILMLIWLTRSFKINIPEEIKETDLEIVFW